MMHQKHSSLVFRFKYSVFISTSFAYPNLFSLSKNPCPSRLLPSLPFHQKSKQIIKPFQCPTFYVIFTFRVKTNYKSVKMLIQVLLYLFSEFKSSYMDRWVDIHIQTYTLLFDV